MNLLEDISKYLADAGLVQGMAIDVYKDTLPTAPDRCVSISEYNGTGPAMFTETAVRSVQLRIREATYQAAHDLAWGLYKELNKDNPFLSVGSRKCLLNMRNVPTKLEIDTSSRTIFVFNIGITTDFD